MGAAFMLKLKLKVDCGNSTLALDLVPRVIRAGIDANASMCGILMENSVVSSFHEFGVSKVRQRQLVVDMHSSQKSACHVMQLPSSQGRGH